MDSISDKHEVFCLEYTKDWNATRAYLVAYPNSSEESARSNVYRLLREESIRQRIEHFKSNLEEAAGVSKLKVIEEFMKIAFSSFTSLQKDWITQREFDELTEAEKACIASIEKEEVTYGDTSKSVFKVKLHDKMKALENISKLLGYNYKPELRAKESITINIVEPEY